MYIRVYMYALNVLTHVHSQCDLVRISFALGTTIYSLIRFTFNRISLHACRNSNIEVKSPVFGQMILALKSRTKYYYIYVCIANGLHE